MNIEKVIKLSNEYQDLFHKKKEVDMLLKERSDFDSYSITHGNFEIEIYHTFKPLIIETLEDYQSKINVRLEEIKSELNTTD